MEQRIRRTSKLFGDVCSAFLLFSVSFVWLLSSAQSLCCKCTACVLFPFRRTPCIIFYQCSVFTSEGRRMGKFCAVICRSHSFLFPLECLWSIVSCSCFLPLANEQVGEKVYSEYTRKTPRSIVALDCIALAAGVSALVHLVYLGLFGSFPFNAFLSALFCCLGVAVSTICLRLQVHPLESELASISRERAAAEYLAWNALLLITAFNFIG